MLKGLSTVVSLALIATQSFAFEAAVDVDPPSFVQGTPVENTNHGWQFTVDRPLRLTLLGLLDVSYSGASDPDGFDVAHDVGLFLTNGSLLTSGTLSQGSGDMLVENFRYVPVPTITLSAGVNYVIAYHTAFPNEDPVVLNPPQFQTHPFVNYAFARWGFQTSSLSLPTNTLSGVDHRFGPNFLFVIPEPNGLLLIGVSMLWLPRGLK